MDFYGKLVDQHGDPVVGAKVVAAMGVVISPVESGGQKIELKTDEAGRFSLLGHHASGVGFIPSKDGYLFSQRQEGSTRPNDYVPDPGKPMVLRMWKLKGAEWMIHTSIQGGLACDGTPRRFDPMTGRRDIGPLVVTLTRKPLNLPARRDTPFDWTLTLEIEGGGLIPTNDIYPYQASVDGYKSQSISMLAGDKHWLPWVTQSYYVFDGKNYGCITIDLAADYQPPPTHFEVKAYMNPAGSRNLEFDPYKQIR